MTLVVLGHRLSDPFVASTPVCRRPWHPVIDGSTSGKGAK